MSALSASEPDTEISGPEKIVIGLNAAIVTASEARPAVLTLKGGRTGREGLPFGIFDPRRHRTMELGVRSLVREQVGLQLGHVEQLYTFGDRGRLHYSGATTGAGEGGHVVSIGYLAITGLASVASAAGVKRETDAGPYRWRDWYGFFPWEDWRDGRPPMLDAELLPALSRWVKAESAAGAATESAVSSSRRAAGLAPADRLRIHFGMGDVEWDEERVLERYELLYQAGLVREAILDGRVSASGEAPAWSGIAMRYDHRRILATAMGRLRGKLKYRPLVFETMPERFTLYELQRVVEAISGHRLHKQNFRRLVERGRLVEDTGGKDTSAGGRPAALMRFRRQVLHERPAPGLRLGATRIGRG